MPAPSGFGGPAPPLAADSDWLCGSVTGAGCDSLATIGNPTSAASSSQDRNPASRLGHSLSGSVSLIPKDKRAIFRPSCSQRPSPSQGHRGTPGIPASPLSDRHRFHGFARPSTQPALRRIRQWFPCGTCSLLRHKHLMFLRFLASASPAYSHEGVIRIRVAPAGNDTARLWITWITWIDSEPKRSGWPYMNGSLFSVHATPARNRALRTRY
ncbi:hypothetical protein ACVWZA_002599 [Sphingomonas sp. UYAg733]